MSSPDRDVKPDLELPKQASPSKKAKGEEPAGSCSIHTFSLIRLAPCPVQSFTAIALTKKSPSKAGSRSVKSEITGTGDESGFKPTSKDMAYHYVMHALDKVTIETRKEIAQKLGVRQKNLDAVGSQVMRVKISWFSYADLVVLNVSFITVLVHQLEVSQLDVFRLSNLTICFSTIEKESIKFFMTRSASKLGNPRR